MNYVTTQDRDARIENFAAELTCAVYPVVLRQSGRERWLNLELGLWTTLRKTIRKWADRRPADSAVQELDAWRDGILVDLTENAFSVAVRNGIHAPHLEVELSLYRVFRIMLGKRLALRSSQARYS
jgi:hypothetical protein